MSDNILFLGTQMRFFLICCFIIYLPLFGYGQGLDSNRKIENDKTRFPFANVLEEGEEEKNTVEGANIDFRKVLKDDIIEDLTKSSKKDGSYFKEFLKLFRIESFTSKLPEKNGTLYTEKKAGIAFIFNIINIVIALSAFIALCFLIYGFYGIFFSSDEEGYSKARTILKNTAIALTIIGISFFMSMMVAYVYNTVVR